MQHVLWTHCTFIRIHAKALKQGGKIIPSQMSSGIDISSF